MTSEACDCPICYSSIHTAGRHRLVSLPCGHLFGHSCVLQWTQHSLVKGESRHARCPVCNAEYRKSLIRILYPGHADLSGQRVSSSSQPSALLAPAATTIRFSRSPEPETCTECEQYRTKCEALEKASSGLQEKYEDIRVKYALLKSEALLLESRLAKRHRKEEPGFQIRHRPVFQYGQSVSFAASMDSEPAAHSSFSCIDSDGRDTVLWTSGKTCSWLSLLDPSFVSRQSPGQGHIRQALLVSPLLLCSGTEARGSVLYCTMAGELGLYSLASQTLLIAYRQPAPLWSCATWRNAEYQLWAGDAKGSLHAYDTRRAGRGPLYSVPLSASSRTPVHSLFQYDSRRLVAATFDGLYVIDMSGSNIQAHGLTVAGTRAWRPLRDGAEGASAICTFATMDTADADWEAQGAALRRASLLSTWRRFPLGPEQRSLNVYAALYSSAGPRAQPGMPTVASNECDAALVEPVATFEASNGQKSLGRSSLYRSHVHMVDEPSASLVVLGYDQALKKFELIQKISHSGSSPASARSKIVAVKRISEQTLVHVTEDASIHLYHGCTTTTATAS